MPSKTPTQAKKSSGQLRDTLVFTVGAVCLLAGIVGGGVKGPGWEIPSIGPIGPRVLIGIVGLVLIAVSLAPRWWPWILRSEDRKRERAYEDLILKVNDLFFVPGGIKDLLIAYRKSMSKGDWDRVTRRAQINRRKLASVRSAKDALKSLARDPTVERTVDHLLAAKAFRLYDELAALNDPPADDVVRLIEAATYLEAMTTQLEPAQQVLTDRLEEVRKSRRKHEDNVIGR